MVRFVVGFSRFIPSPYMYFQCPSMIHVITFSHATLVIISPISHLISDGYSIIGTLYSNNTRNQEREL